MVVYGCVYAWFCVSVCIVVVVVVVVVCVCSCARAREFMLRACVLKVMRKSLKELLQCIRLYNYQHTPTVL